MAEALGDIGELGDDLAAFLAARHVQVDAADRIAPRRAVGAQGFEPANTGHAAGAAGFHALANPDFLLRQQLVGLGVDDGLLRHLLVLLDQVLRKVAGIGAQLAAVQLDDDGGHVVQKGPVMGDGDDAAVEIDQQLFQPGYRVQVQVVGRLVEQQHVGPGDQRLGQRHALFGAARERADDGVLVQVQAVQGFFDALLPVPAVQRLDFRLQGVQIGVLVGRQVLLHHMPGPCQSCAGSYENRSVRVQAGLLRDIGNAQVLLQLQGAVVGFVDARQDFEQG